MRIILFITIVVAFIGSGCKKTTVVANTNTVIDTVRIIPVDTVIVYKSYLALGDSYTIGQSVAVSERFPVQTIDLLNQANIKFTQPEIIAQTGWTTTSLINRLTATQPLKTSYDIVTLLIGVNNQFQGLSLTDYKPEFTTLLNKAIQLTNNNPQRVIVLSIPDYSVTPFVTATNKSFVANQIDSFNAANYSIALQANVQYINITPSTRLAATDFSLLASDRLHPSGIEYKKWADSLQRRIRAVL
jgi:lysophospholipase L1-like esterase